MILFAFACSASPAQPMMPCPSSPNCVSSQASSTDAEHAIAPITIANDADWARLNAIVAGMSRVELVTETPTYRHYTFTTALLRFTDDVELTRADPIVHVRSASRVGNSDLGVNRRRVEAIRAEYDAVH